MAKMTSNLTGVFLDGLAEQLSSSKWNSYVELKYRVFVRQAEDVQYKIDEARRKFLDIWESHIITKEIPVTFQEVFDEYWPIKSEDIKKCEQKGYLLTEYQSHKCIIVRELPIRLDISKVDPHIDIGYMVEKACENNFAVIQVVREKTLEIQAF